MNTATRAQSGQRFAQLAATGEVVFHTRDLANLWGITDTSTLYMTLTRYVQRGLLHRIYKGLYALVPPTEIDPLLLGMKAVHAYAYVSTETILAQAGVIFQAVPHITIVSDTSVQFSVGAHRYRVRQMADHYLHQPDGISLIDGVLTATTERAIADLLYFNPRAYFDNPRAVNWDTVRALQETIQYSSNIPV